MAIIKPTGVAGTVTAVLIHQGGDSIATAAADGLELSFDGVEGDSHYGATRPSCVRVRKQYEDGTPIRNVRQVTVVSDEELAKIAGELDVAGIEPAWLGANVAVTGIPDLTLIPPSTRLIFSGGASLVVDAENAPCRFPGMEIDKVFPGHGKRFPVVAQNLRGVTAWVEREGRIGLGDAVEVHIPPQRIWRPGAA